MSVDCLVRNVEQRFENETEFLQAFKEVGETIRLLLDSDPKYIDALERIVEPERQLMFRVTMAIRCQLVALYALFHETFSTKRLSVGLGVAPQHCLSRISVFQCKRT